MAKLYILPGILVLLLSGCEHVKPLDRNYLAKEHMSSNPYPMETAMQEHHYVSREATQSGMGPGGAASCGCA